MRFAITSSMKMVAIVAVLTGFVDNAKADECQARGSVAAIWTSNHDAAITLGNDVPYKNGEAVCDCQIGDASWSWVNVATSQGSAIYSTLLAAKSSGRQVEVVVETGLNGLVNIYHQISCKIKAVGIID